MKMSYSALAQDAREHYQNLRQNYTDICIFIEHNRQTIGFKDEFYEELIFDLNNALSKLGKISTKTLNDDIQRNDPAIATCITFLGQEYLDEITEKPTKIEKSTLSSTEPLY